MIIHTVHILQLYVICFLVDTHTINNFENLPVYEFEIKMSSRWYLWHLLCERHARPVSAIAQWEQPATSWQLPHEHLPKRCRSSSAQRDWIADSVPSYLLAWHLQSDMMFIYSILGSWIQSVLLGFTPDQTKKKAIQSLIRLIKCLNDTWCICKALSQVKGHVGCLYRCNKIWSVMLSFCFSKYTASWSILSCCNWVMSRQAVKSHQR